MLCNAMGPQGYFWPTWPSPTFWPALASLSKNPSKGNVGTAQAIQQQASQLMVSPANSALAGVVSKVSTSSYNMSHMCFFSNWTIKQIHEFVSVDSLMAVYVTQHMGESGLNIKTASTLVHAAPI